ncbi:MAG TPA: tetratricopeptide repeat protein [Rhodocyclaceae bacterium]|nr:tetratricopeptide repeat protein [Rhodocyclaceae bacterium]
MLRQRSTLAVAAAKRPRLVPPIALAGFTALVGMALVVMYPYRVIVETVLREQHGDELTLAYLHNLLRTNSNNPELIFRLAEQQLSANDLAGMRQSLGKILNMPDEADRITARMLLWRASELEWLRSPPASTQRAALQRSLLAELEALSRMHVNEQTRVQIAERALDFNELALAIRLYRSLKTHDGKFNDEWFAGRARQLIGEHEYEAALQLYLIARERATTLEARRSLFFRAVQVPLSRNQSGAALALAEEQLKDLSDDVDSLMFMVKLARSANQPDVAARYARLMLRLTLLERWRRLALDEAFAARWRLVADAPSPAGGPPQRPFDEGVYALGYDAFVAARQLDDAYRVATSAVRQAPQSADWRLRLARVAEWSGRPQEALTHWRWLLEHPVTNSVQDEAAQALLRLAPGLFDDSALLLAQTYALARQPDDLQLRRLIDTYERLGQPDEAIRAAQNFVKAHPQAAPMQMLADLAERAARMDLAINTLRQMNARFGVTRERAIKLASLYVGQGRIGDAHTALSAVRDKVAADDTLFWRSYGALAELQQDDDQARTAYAQVIDFGKADVKDFNALIDLLAEADPVQAAALSARAARKFDSWPHLIRALDLYTQAGHAADVERLLASLDARWLALGENDAYFLSLRATHFRSRGRTVAALADYERWLALNPGDSASREGLLWLLVDSHNSVALRTMLAAHETDWAAETSLHDVLAAAWVTLSAPHVALERYLSPRLDSHRHDFLWLMNYADVLEQDQQTDTAWRLRRALMRQRPAADTTALTEQALREARVRLALAQTPGDPALAALRELLRQDRAAQAKPGAVSDELALAWLLSQGEPAAARSYLWSRYARHLAQPGWATLATALAEDDWTSVDALLSRRDIAPSRYDSVSAANMLGKPGEAATQAFDSQTLQRDDEALQLQLTEVLLEQAPRVSVEADRRDLGQWLENEQRVGVAAQLTPHLRAALDLGRVARQVDASQMIAAPNEQSVVLKLQHRANAYETRLALGQRESLAPWTSLAFAQTLYARGPANLALRVDWRQPADESPALRAMGWRNALRLEGGYRLSQDDQVGLTATQASYDAQNGLSLGSGQRAELSLVHSLHRETREANLEVFWNFNHFSSKAPFDESPQLDEVAGHLPGDGSASERVATLIPQSYNFYGLRLSTEMARQTTYTRAFRPFGTVAYTYNTQLGTGYSFGFGLAGSVLGNDHLAAGIYSEKGGSHGVSNSTTYGLHYWLAF